jgi:SRSO17 transposase
VLDETGFVKKGSASVGVARQYCSPLGKVENCQVGVFLSYTGPRGHVLLDRALYLPEAWCNDPKRCADAHVPSSVQFQTKPQLALSMLRHAWQRGVPMAWVTGDEVYGDDPALRDGIDAAGHRYVLAVISSTPVWTEPPEVEPPEAAERRHGPPRTRARLAAGAPHAKKVAEVVAQWPAAQWHRFAVEQGEKGPILYDWACARVIDSRARLPAAEVWLLARRSIPNPSEIAYYLSNASADTSLETLAHVASYRYTIEQCFEEAKDDLGLDQYEVRTWTSWYHFVTLVMMALAWLASVRAKLLNPSSSLARALDLDPAEPAPHVPPSPPPRALNGNDTRDGDEERSPATPAPMLQAPDGDTRGGGNDEGSRAAPSPAPQAPGKKALRPTPRPSGRSRWQHGRSPRSAAC